MRHTRLLAALAVLLLTPLASLAADRAGGTRPPFAIGLQRTSYTTAGALVGFDAGERLELQGFVSAYCSDGNRSVLGGRAAYRLLLRPAYDVYAAAAVGAMKIDAFFPYSGSETASFWGTALGVEYDTRSILSEKLPLFVRLEVGLEGTFGFDYFDTNYTTLTVSPGIALRF